MSDKIIKFDYRGDELHLVPLPDGDVGVVLRRLCECVPVDVRGQTQRLQRLAAAGVKWATTCVIHAVAEDGKMREMVVLPRRSIPIWAATLDVSRLPKAVRPVVKAKLIAYIDECAQVLADRFMPDRRPPDIAALEQRVEQLEQALEQGEAQRAVLETRLQRADIEASGVIGKTRAQRWILAPLREAARMHGAAEGDFSEKTFLREFKDRENQVRLHVHFPAALAQRWEHLPLEKFGEAQAKAMEIRERDRRRTRALVKQLKAKLQQLELPVH